jgi:predicted Rossmann fold flavoprotein
VKKIFDIAIIGAGASGLMAASLIKDKDIAVIDSNPKIGLKILASGGGKCNITNKNISVKNYLCDENFATHALKSFGSHELLSFVKEFDLALELRKRGQYFCKNSARDLVAIFSQLTKKCNFFLSQKVLHVSHEECFIIETDKEKIYSKKLLVASGGLSYASIGASGIGYEIAKTFGHSIITPSPALVGLTVQKEQFWMKELSGVCFYVKLKAKEKILDGDLLFTHKGISGPVILSGSLFWDKGKIEIDFLPDIEIQNLLKKAGKKIISSALPLPKRFLKSFLFSINLDDKPCDRLSVQERENLQQLKSYTFAPAGNFGYTKAEVTKGGVCTNEIDPITFESKLQKNLYFTGEVLDVTGELGGYNFQWAFASSYSFANHI